MLSSKKTKPNEKRLRMMHRRLVNLNEAHQKALDMNKKLVNKVAEQDVALSQARNENLNLTKEKLDLTFTLSLKISQNNELKQLLQNLHTDLNKTLTSVGDISMILLNNYQYFTEHVKKSDDISSQKNSRSQLDMVTKPESNSSLATIKPFMSNPQELYARKKNSQVDKLHFRKQAVLSPIAEIKSPKISRRTPGRKFYCKTYSLRNSDQFQSTIRHSISDNNDCENSGKPSVSWNNEYLSQSRYSDDNNSNNLSDSTPKKKQTCSSQNLKSSEKKTVSFKLSFTSEPSPERSIDIVNSLKLKRKKESSTFEQATETKGKRTGKDSPKKRQSSKRKSNYIVVEELLENNCYSPHKDKVGSRRSQRIKTKVFYNQEVNDLL